MPSSPKAGARCGNAARRDLCRGLWATMIPTATGANADSPGVVRGLRLRSAPRQRGPRLSCGRRAVDGRPKRAALEEGTLGPREINPGSTLRSEIRAGPVVGVARALLAGRPSQPLLHAGPSPRIRCARAPNADATHANFGSRLGDEPDGERHLPRSWPISPCRAPLVCAIARQSADRCRSQRRCFAVGRLPERSFIEREIELIHKGLASA